MKIILDNVEKADFKQLKAYLAAVMPDVVLVDESKADKDEQLVIFATNSARVYRIRSISPDGLVTTECAGVLNENFEAGKPLPKVDRWYGKGEYIQSPAKPDSLLPYRAGFIYSKKQLEAAFKSNK